jgi:hypothetical protein
MCYPKFGPGLGQFSGGILALMGWNSVFDGITHQRMGGAAEVEDKRPTSNVRLQVTKMSALARAFCILEIF